MKNILKKEIKEISNANIMASKILKQVSPKKKAIRTTFTLTKESNEALLFITKVYKSKIKSIIDTICEDVPQPTENKDFHLATEIIEMAKGSKDQLKREVRRTMVLSNKSLITLNDIAKKNDIPRDIILDRGFLIVAEILKQDSKVKFKEHEKALKKINQLWKEAENVKKELEITLNEDDPVLIQLEDAIVYLMNLSISLENEVKNMIPIETDGL